MTDVFLTSGNSETAEVTYRTRPYVCGAVGRWEAATVRRLIDASPPGVREIHSSPTAVLWATGKPESWRTESRSGHIWGSVAEGPPPSSWVTAAEQRLAAGLEVSQEGAVLHTCSLGLQDLFVRAHGDALYFSVRIDPLLDLADERVHVDWSAWVNILALTCPLGDSTPFQEVRRMQAATAWRATATAIERLDFEPDWLKVEPLKSPSAADIVDILGSHVRQGGRRTVITLSGGWDSRLLAILASRRRRRMVAWTTSNDDGRDRDIKYAQPVAEALGLTHKVLIPGTDAWLKEHSAVRRRLNFQTTHHVWIMPLARVLHRSKGQSVDGLAGGVLLQSAFVDQKIADTSEPARQRSLLWTKLTQNRLRQRGLLAPSVALAFEEISRTAFNDVTARFDGHCAAPTLGVLHTRTARAIASSGQWLLAPEIEVQLPFVHPDVINAALRVPLSAKVGGGFCRQVLHAANPDVAGLPSTKDATPKGKRGARRQTAPRALATMANAILEGAGVRELLSAELRLALRDPNALSLIGRTMTGMRVLNWASMLGEWQATYAERLVKSEFRL